MKTWITEKLKGTSVPVALRFNTIKVNGVETSEDWSNACLILVDLGNLPEFNTSELKSLGTTDFTYTVKVTVASDTVQASAASTAADQTILNKFKELIASEDEALQAVIDQLVDKEDPAQLSEIVNGKTTATGSLPYVTGFEWFNTAVEEEQEGNYLVFTIEAKTAEERAAFMEAEESAVIVSYGDKKITKASFDDKSNDSVYLIMIVRITADGSDTLTYTCLLYTSKQSGGRSFIPSLRGLLFGYCHWQRP